MRRILLFLVPLLLAAGRLAGQAGLEPRLVVGTVYAADGSPTEGVRVEVRGEVYSDSARVDSAGAFSFRVPRFPIGPLEVTIGEAGEETAFHPIRLRLRPADRADALAAVLIPRRFTIPEGGFRGTVVPIDVVGATTRPCSRCGAFYRELLGDTLPGRPPGIPSWPDSVFPLHVAIDPEVGPRISPRDSVSFWRVAEEVEAAFGRDLFEPTSIDDALDPDRPDSRGVVLVSVNPSLPDADGWGNSAAQGGDLLAAAVMLREASDFTGPNARFLVSHELLHGLGFGHTCAWRSVVAATQLPGAPRLLRHAGGRGARPALLGPAPGGAPPRDQQHPRRHPRRRRAAAALTASAPRGSLSPTTQPTNVLPAPGRPLRSVARPSPSPHRDARHPYATDRHRAPRDRPRARPRLARGGAADRGARRGRHHPGGVLRPRHRRRLRPPELHAAHRVLDEARAESRPHEAGGDRQDGRGAPAATWRSSPRRRTRRTSSATGRSRERLARAEGLTDEQAQRARARGQGGGLDRRRAARHRGARRAAAHRDRLPAGQPRRPGDAAHPRRRHRARGAGQPGRDGAGLRLVHARAGPEEAQHLEASRACTRSTSGTTTTATSTCRRSPRRRT